MALRKVAIPVRFAGGIDTKEDPKGVLPTKLLALENGTFSVGASIGKRNGHARLGTAVIGSSTSMSDAVALAKREDELIALAAEKGYSYSAQQAAWQDAGNFESVTLSHKPVLDAPERQVLVDGATLNGVTVCAWDDTRNSNNVHYSVSDAATGRIIVAATALETTSGLSTMAQVYPAGVYLHIVYITSSGLLKLAKVSTLNPGAGADSPVTLFSDLDTSANGYSIDSDGTTVAFAYWRAVVNGGGVRVGYIDDSGVVGTPVTGWPSPIVHATPTQADIFGPSVSVDYQGSGHVAVFYGTTPSSGDDYVRWGAYTSDLATATVADAAISAVGTSAAAGDGGLALPGGALLSGRLTSCFATDAVAGERTCYVYFEVNGTPHLHEVLTANLAGTSALSRANNGAIASRPWRQGTHVYMVAAYVAPLWTTYIVYREDGLIVGRLLSGTAFGRPTKEMFPAVSASGDAFTLYLGYNKKLETIANAYNEPSIREVVLDWGTTNRNQSVELGSSMYLGGAGFLWQYDGEGFVEAGFFYPPELGNSITRSVVASGSMTSTGVYTYRFAYGWKNAQGEIEWGPISAGSEYTLGASDDTMNVFVRTMRDTMKRDDRSDAFIGVFRTENGGSLYYLCSGTDPSVTTGANAFLPNNPDLSEVAFVDKMSDATLITKEPLYTTGGILSNDGFESGAIVAGGKSRIFTSDVTDSHVVRYSQQVRDSYALEQADGLSLRFDPYGGDITGIAVMDESVVVFKKAAIYYVAGPGPLANPDAGGGFSEPQLITSDVGCTNQRSIATTPAGLVFQSAKGIYLLGRDRSVKYIGAPVEAYNSQTITSADTIEDKTHVVFLTSSGRTLLWDYYFDQWSTFINHEGADSVVVAGEYYYLRNNGDVYQLSTATHLDGTSQAMLAMETAWIKIAGYLQGFQRIYHIHILGEYKSAHTLRVRLAYDYEDGWGAPIDLDPSQFIVSGAYGGGIYGAGAYGGAGVSRYQFKVHVGTKCEAFRVRFEGIEATGADGAAFELSEMLVIGGVKGHAHKEHAERMG